MMTLGLKAWLLGISFIVLILLMWGFVLR